jgi:hypothetical protein
MQQITVVIDLQDQLNMLRTNICPSSGAQDCKLCTISLKAAVLPGLISGRALVKKKKIANYSMWYGVLL